MNIEDEDNEDADRRLVFGAIGIVVAALICVGAALFGVR